MPISNLRPLCRIEIPHEQHIGKTEEAQRYPATDSKAGSVLDNFLNLREITFDIDLFFGKFRQDDAVIDFEFLA